MVRTTSSSSAHLSLTNKMNHYKSCSGNITTRSGSDNSIDNKEDDTPIGLIIQFLNAESCAFTEASLACSSLTPIVCVPILLIGCAHVEAPHINRALAPTLCAPAPSTTPHLGYIGVPNPPRGRSSMSRDDDGDGGSHWEQEAVAAAEAYILPPHPLREQGISSLMLMRNKMKSRYYLS